MRPRSKRRRRHMTYTGSRDQVDPLKSIEVVGVELREKSGGQKGT